VDSPGIANFNDDSGFLSDQGQDHGSPLKRTCPRPAAFHSPNRGTIFSASLPGNLLGAPVKRRKEIRRILKVKRRLFDIDESPKKKLKIKDEEINFENEVAKIVKICKKIKSKRLKGSNRSPGSPFDNISFTRVKKLLIILQLKLEDSLTRMLEDESEAIELCFALWPLLKRIPTKWETSAARKVSEEPIKILKSFLSYLLRRKAKYLSTHQNLNLQERLKTIDKNQFIEIISYLSSLAV
jgi:hypothetical protein